MKTARILGTLGLLIASTAMANPHWDRKRVPMASEFVRRGPSRPARPLSVASAQGLPSLRVLVGWEGDDVYSIRKVVREFSGTEALNRRARVRPKLGSFVGKLIHKTTGLTYWDSIGTGTIYRRLVRELTFRFPEVDAQSYRFELWAEDAETGVPREVLSLSLPTPENLRARRVLPDVEVRTLRPATTSPKLLVNVYSEGYLASTREKFFSDAQRIVRTFEETKFPGQEHFEIRAVFQASPIVLGPARNLGMPVPEFGTNLGLFYPYWEGFGRWYHVVYPTREDKYRRALGAVAYDYPIALVNSTAYWGVGNYRELTAIPADNGAFSYLLLHEFGHFMGLNEEYEGGGRTELEFEAGMQEPWSQNITFLREPAKLKWASFVDRSTTVPTPVSRWRAPGGPWWGAYRGGYADSPVKGGHSHKPGFACTMEAGRDFCPICQHALREAIRADLGAGARK